MRAVLFVWSACPVILFLGILSTCSAQRLHNQNHRDLVTPEQLPLKDAAPFPVGNVWSAGQETWGSLKGTDLGGPSDVFSEGAFINGYGVDQSTVVRKQLNIEQEHLVLATQFNSLTPEIALKPHNIAVNPYEIDFREADAMMDFAEANGMRVHGHVLLFDSSVPQWAFDFRANNTWTPQEWEDWLENYIKTVVGRYKGRIAGWDVLNEIGAASGGGLNREGLFWYQVAGNDESIIDKAFHWAHEADPDAKLFINDYMSLPFKFLDILGYADTLRSRGVPIDGIGSQCHIALPFIEGGYLQNFIAFKAFSDHGFLFI